MRSSAGPERRRARCGQSRDELVRLRKIGDPRVGKVTLGRIACTLLIRLHRVQEEVVKRGSLTAGGGQLSDFLT